MKKGTDENYGKLSSQKKHHEIYGRARQTKQEKKKSKKEVKPVEVVEQSLKNDQDNGYSIYDSDWQSKDSIEFDEFEGQSSFELELEEDKPAEEDKDNIDKLMNRLGLKSKPKKTSENIDLQLAVNEFVENCIGAINKDQNISNYEQVYGLEYKEKLKDQTESMSIYVTELTGLEKIEKISTSGFYGLYRHIRMAMKKFSMLCEAIVQHSLFESIVLLIIVLNSLKMALDDPLSTTTSLPALENLFTALYTTQMCLKIMAYGLMFNSGAYLRDIWNVLDFVIVCTSLLPLIITIGFSVNSLRAIRVMRPLKTITKVRALKMIVRTLFLSFSLVMDSLYIMIFVIIVFAIAGMQLFSGKLKMVCMDLTTGYMFPTKCEINADCLVGQICAKGISSPNFSIYNFDTFGWSLLSVYKILLLEDWSTIMQDLQITTGFAYCFYAIAIVFICEYVLLNMTLAILKYKYSQVKGNAIEEDEEEKDQYQTAFLKKIGVFDNISRLVEEAPLTRYRNPDKILVGCCRSVAGGSDDRGPSLLTMLKQPKYSSRMNFSKKQGLQRLDIEQLKALGKVTEKRWDAKNLVFEASRGVQQLVDKNEIEAQEEDNDKKVVKEESSGEEQSFMSYNSSDDGSQDDEGVADKLLELQKKLKQSTKDLASKPQQHKQPTNNKIYGDNTKAQPVISKEINRLGEMLQLISSDRKPVKEKFQVHIPDVDWSSIKSEDIYRRFDDLGQFKIHRLAKRNQLSEFGRNKAERKKQNKKKQAILQVVNEEGILDIKELHLKNELQKKQLKCRLKPIAVLDTYRHYDQSRIIVSQLVRETLAKKQTIENNIMTMKFIVKYRLGERKHKTVNKSFLRRNLMPSHKNLMIPEMPKEKQLALAIKESEKKMTTEQENKYSKMLQNRQMEANVEMEMEPVLSAFFKKQKPEQVKQEQSLEDIFTKTRQDDVLKKHGRLALDYPLQDVPQQSCIQYNPKQVLQMMNMSSEQYDIYIKGWTGLYTVVRKKTLLLISRQGYDNFMLAIVLLNTLVMAMDGLVNTDNDPYYSINTTCTYLFTADIALKIIAYGFGFLNDMMNIFDSLVVSISIVELTLGSSNLSALKSIRVLRAFRVLRITRLIRSLNYMKIVMAVVSSVINEFIYILLLLFLCIFIYTLLGMQIFGGNILSSTVTGVRQNFDTFLNALFTVFQVITIQNWNDIETVVITSTIGPLGDIYLISLIFIGNWILINLLQAILIDGFDKDSSDADEPEQVDREQEETSESEIGSETANKTVEKESENISAMADVQDQNGEQDASLFLFTKSGIVRRWAIRISNSLVFEWGIVLIIMLSSLKLAIDTYLPNDGPMVQLASNVDLFFNFVFISQMVVKVISMGFLVGKTAYLKSSWNILDFLIVMASIIDMLLTNVNLSIIKLFRTLRPLRIISRNQDMKIMISSLAQSIFGIFNVLIIILCVFLMFGILGLNLLQGKLNFCNIGPYKQGNNWPYINEATCKALGGIWLTQFTNFENVLNALITLWVFSTRQNWPYYAFSFMDASDDGPVLNNNQLLYTIFCIVFIFVCSMFFMDLLVGVLFMNYHQSQSKIRPKKLTDKQINWQNLQKVIIEQDPCFKLYLKPTNAFQKFFYLIVSQRIFEILITMCIFGNIIVMMIGQDDNTDALDAQLNQANIIFSLVFIVEMVLKLLAFSKAYFQSMWNIFDFCVVMASLLDLGMQFTGLKSAGNSTLSILPQIARIFRVMRITRLLRMFKRFKGLQKLIETFIFSLPALAKGLSILFLYLFIFSILACNLFQDVDYDYSGYLNIIKNYSNFHHALQMLFINITGQNWYFYMFQTIYPNYVQCSDGTSTTCTSYLYIIFWLPFIFFGQKVFLQLFVLIVLDQFEANYINENNPLGIFSLFEDDFRENWIQLTCKYHAEKIEAKRMIDLLMVLRPPLGLGRVELLKKYEEELGENQKITKEQIQNKVSELDVKLKRTAAKRLHTMNIMKNRIYFGYHETFYHFAKQALVPEFIDSATTEQLEVLQQMHKRSQEALEKLRPEGNLFYFEQGNTGGNDEPLNPISLILYTQMILKSWHNYSLKYQKKKLVDDQKNKQPLQSLNNSCASDIEQAQFEKINIGLVKATRRGGMMEAQQGEQRVEEGIKKVPPKVQAYYRDNRHRTKHNAELMKRRKSSLDNQIALSLRRLEGSKSKKDIQYPRGEKSR